MLVKYFRKGIEFHRVVRTFKKTERQSDERVI